MEQLCFYPSRNHSVPSISLISFISRKSSCDTAVCLCHHHMSLHLSIQHDLMEQENILSTLKDS